MGDDCWSAWAYPFLWFYEFFRSLVVAEFDGPASYPPSCPPPWTSKHTETPKRTLTPISFASADQGIRSRSATFQPTDANEFLTSTYMIGIYCGFGAFLIVTLVICAVLKRNKGQAVAHVDYTEGMTGPLVEDPSLSNEFVIQI
jgi:hypothetical protein